MAVSGPHRIRRQQIIREAEGYLELISVYEENAPSLPLKQRMCQRSLDLLNRLPDVGAERGHALYLKGQVLRTLERYEEAIPPLRDAAQLDPDNLQIWLALGWCYKRTGRLDLAIEALEEGVSADPMQAIVYYNLACYWSLARNKRNALDYLHRALELDGDFRYLLEQEHDFDPIRNDPGFQALLTVVV